MKNKKIVYIIGTGRNGSTLLDITLGNNKNIQSCGEIFNILYAFKTNKTCSCGMSALACPFWSHVRDKFLQKIQIDDLASISNLIRKFERKVYSPFTFYFSKKLRTKSYKNYLNLVKELYFAIFEASSKSIIIDSSKNPLRAYALYQIFKNDIYFIHLIRDGRGQMWSWIKSGVIPPRNLSILKNKSSKYGNSSIKIKWWAPWVYSFAWIFYNLLASKIFHKVKVNHRTSIMYEKFTDNPIKTLKIIANLISINLDDLENKLLKGDSLYIEHLLTGNRIRSKKKIKLKKPDEEWKVMLSSKYKNIFWVLAGWLASKYGYKYKI